MIQLSNGEDSIERTGGVIAYRQISLPVFSAGVPDALSCEQGGGITMKSKLVPLPHSPSSEIDNHTIVRWRDHMNYEAINFAKKFGLFDEQWQPKVIAEMNDYQFKIVKLKGDFIWHDHKHTDETFIVLEGVLRIDFREGAVRVSAGEMFVVPKGVEHKPYAEREVKLLLIEPRGVLNTGHEGGDRTAENDAWI
jgi:mannose-6-phosphate isomerase-like protein (cupin superfamily)